MNHPKDKSSKDFICQAFPEIKYYDMSSEYPSQRQVQAPQRRPLPGDSRNPNVLLPQKVRPEPAPTRTPLRRTHHEPRRRDERARPPRPPAMRYACLTPRSTRGPRSSTASARGRTRRRSHGQPSSRTAHEHGRCVYTASECSAVHFADLDTIDCNSSIKEGDVRYTPTRGLESAEGKPKATGLWPEVG